MDFGVTKKPYTRSIQFQRPIYSQSDPFIFVINYFYPLPYPLTFTVGPTWVALTIENKEGGWVT